MTTRNLNLAFISLLSLGAVTLAASSVAIADCEIVQNGKHTPFNGSEFQNQNLAVEKKSLLKLDREYPNLNVVEKTFKGEITTCSSCTDNFLVCGN